MNTQYRAQARVVHRLMFGLFLLLAMPCSVSLAQTITSSGLNTEVSAQIHLPGGQTQFDITGGTRPGGSANLYHSFGNFNVPNNNIANFLNDSGLPTSNILGRVTGGNISNIFGTIQTTGFGSANLFLMNPAGFLFGPNATVNVGGMVTFTSADYLRLADNTRFNAIPHTAPDLLLSAAPVAAFGFLGSNPGAITVQGSQLTVEEGTVISLVGGNITIQEGALTAPSGQINLVSVGSPSKPNVGGEVVVAASGQGTGYNPTGFRSLGTINLSQGSTLDASGTLGSGNEGGSVLIRGGQFVMNDSSLKAVGADGLGNPIDSGGAGGTIEVMAGEVALSNHSTIDTSSTLSAPCIGCYAGMRGHITFNVGTFSATDSAILARGIGLIAGDVTVQGRQGSGTFAHAVSLTNTEVATSGEGLATSAGQILFQADNIALNQSTLDAFAGDNAGGPITLVSRGGLDIRNSTLVTAAGFTSGGPVDLQAETSINLTSTIIDARGFFGDAGSITMAAPNISISNSGLDVSNLTGTAGIISLMGTKAVRLSDGTVLSAVGSGDGTGGTIQVKAPTIKLTDSQLTTSVSSIGSGGGSITVEANNLTLKNSQILSTATEGQGGTIDITSPIFHQDASSVIDASSQSGTDGTVTINGVIQP